MENEIEAAESNWFGLSDLEKELIAIAGTLAGIAVIAAGVCTEDPILCAAYIPAGFIGSGFACLAARYI